MSQDRHPCGLQTLSCLALISVMAKRKRVSPRRGQKTGTIIVSQYAQIDGERGIRQNWGNTINSRITVNTAYIFDYNWCDSDNVLIRAASKLMVSTLASVCFHASVFV